MPSMRIFLTSNPFIQTYSYKPGEKIQIQVNFEDSFIPDRYRLQILDHKNNSRLNRYGGGSSKVIVENWPVPSNIRNDHFGVWFVKVDDISNRLGENNQIVGIMKQIFFVERDIKVEIPILSEMEVSEPQKVPIMHDLLPDEVISPPKSIEPTVVEGVSSSMVFCSVIEIRGIGKTYAERLKKINIETVSDFWYYQDRISLAEVMRINDKRLENMMKEAEIILSQEADLKVSIELEESDEIVPDDLKSVEGLDAESIKKLRVLGVKTKSDLLNFEEISILRTTINTSREEFRSILASIGRIIEPDDVRKPIFVEIPNQPVISVKGIGQVTSRKLNSVGISTVQQLYESNFEVLRSLATKNQYEKWVKNASGLLKKPIKTKIQDERQETSVNELLSLPGIGPKTLEKLRALNISTKAELIEFADQERLRKILRMSVVRFNAFIKSINNSK